MEAVSQVCGTTRATLACAVVVPLVSHGEEQGYNEQSQTSLMFFHASPVTPLAC